MMELHTQTCPRCGARDEGPRDGAASDCRNWSRDLCGVYYLGHEPGEGHQWQCMECGKFWATVQSFVRELAGAAA